MRDKYLSGRGGGCRSCSQALIWVLIGFNLQICMVINGVEGQGWGPGWSPRACRQMPGEEGGGGEASGTGRGSTSSLTPGRQPKLGEATGEGGSGPGRDHAEPNQQDEQGRQWVPHTGLWWELP